MKYEFGKKLLIKPQMTKTSIRPTKKITELWLIKLNTYVTFFNPKSGTLELK